MHILVIEDEEQLCCSIAEGLRLNGYETDTCFDGDEGLELCLTENYDLILLDLNLPGIDGLEILRQFREINSFTPVLMTVCHFFCVVQQASTLQVSISRVSPVLRGCQ